MKVKKLIPIIASTMATIAALGVTTKVAASDFPAKPVKIIVPFAPGGTTDIVGRLIADKLSQSLGQPFIVENRAGAGGAIGTDAIAKAPADGYVLGISTLSSLAVNPACNPKLSYDPLKDFSYITNVAGVPNVVTVNPNKIPAKNFDDMLRLIKSNPGKYTYATSGACGIGHMMGELFQESTKSSLNHIPYRGAGPALTDVLGGQVDMMFDNLPSSVPHIQGGKLKAIAIAAPKRVALFPDVPTFAEVGHPLVNEQASYGLIGPANLPAEVVKKLNDAIVKMLSQSDVKAKLDSQGASGIGNAPAEFRKQIETEYVKMKNIVKTKNINFMD